MSGVGNEYEVESIIDTKTRHRKQLYLVRWKGFSSEADTWEPEENLTSCKSLINSFKASQRASRSQTPAKVATPRKQSPARTKAKSPTRPKTPERPKRSTSAERAKPKKAVEQTKTDEVDERPKQVVTPLPTALAEKPTELAKKPTEIAKKPTEIAKKPTEIAKKPTEPAKKLFPAEETVQLMRNGLITQRSSLHMSKSPVTMKKENGRYPTVSEMRDLAVLRSKAKYGIQEPTDEFSDGDDENDGPHPRGWPTSWPRWGRHLMVCSLVVVGIGACVWTALASFPASEKSTET